MTTVTDSHNCPQCAALRHALLSFTGVIKNSNDPEIKKAANQLYKNVKRVKINSSKDN